METTDNEEVVDYTLSDALFDLVTWDDFKEYQCYDAFGRLRYSISRYDLNTALIAFVSFGTLYRGVWELRIGDMEETIEARLHADYQFDGKEREWRRPELIFQVVR